MGTVVIGCHACCHSGGDGISTSSWSLSLSEANEVGMAMMSLSVVGSRSASLQKAANCLYPCQREGCNITLSAEFNV